MNDHQRIAIQALESMKGDDLYRAEQAFKGLSDNELDQEYGLSGRTKRQIIDEYREHNRKIDAAINWIKEINQ